MRPVLIATFLTVSIGVFAQTDVERFAEARIALDKFHDCPAALKALQAIPGASAVARDPAYLFYMAKSHECLNHNEAALEWYSKYAEQLPPNAEILDKIGELRYLIQKAKAKEVEDAADREAKARAAETAQARALYQRDIYEGTEFFDKGDLVPAIDAFLSAARHLPDAQPAHLYLARSYARSDQLDKAMAELRAAARTGPLTIPMLSPFIEFAPLVPKPEFRTFVEESLGGTSARGLPQLRTTYLDKLLYGLPEISIRAYGGDTDHYYLSQRYDRESGSCRLTMTISDDFRRDRKIIQMESRKTIILPLDQVATFAVQRESGPTTAILRIASNAKDQPTVPERWFADVSAQGARPIFSIATYEYESEADGMFITHTPKELKTAGMAARAKIYLGEKPNDAQSTLRSLQLAVALCHDKN